MWWLRLFVLRTSTAHHVKDVRFYEIKHGFLGHTSISLHSLHANILTNGTWARCPSVVLRRRCRWPCWAALLSMWQPPQHCRRQRRRDVQCPSPMLSSTDRGNITYTLHLHTSSSAGFVGEFPKSIVQICAPNEPSNKPGRKKKADSSLTVCRCMPTLRHPFVNLRLTSWWYSTYKSFPSLRLNTALQAPAVWEDRGHQLLLWTTSLPPPTSDTAG